MFVISVYDLHDGSIISTEEFEKFQDAVNSYEIAAKHYTNYCTGDCFGVLLYCGLEGAPIVCGFGDSVEDKVLVYY